MVVYRSVSQYKEYRDCPYRYYLRRVARAWQRPAAWLAQGIAVHQAAEAWERSGRRMPLTEAQDVFRTSYAAETNRMCSTTPNLEFWFPSGPYAGEQDIERRYQLGLEQVARYVTYYSDHAPDEIIWTTPDGVPAVELAFDVELGGVRVRGLVDQVVIHPVHGLLVRDIKSGNNPGDAFQLGTYAEAVRERYGVAVALGDYWMGRRGKPTVAYKLDQWPRRRLAEAYREVDEGIKEERFDPQPDESKCRFCPVATACRFAV